MEKKYIYYLGETNRIENSFNKIIKKEVYLGHIILRFIRLEEDDLTSVFSKFLEAPPRALFLELNKFNINFKNFLLLMKSHSKLRNVRYFSVFEEKNILEQIKNIYSFGMEYGFILGEELDDVLRDAIYLSVDSNVI
ncbi:MAG: hypothetical protein OXB84_05200, partial [Halobacteriovoraceae bacterium]|nr:hypothetical protein [Halobacteriovoraceae bacterium]